MGYFINGKEVGYAEYIKYLENTILAADNNLYETQQSGLHILVKAVNVIKENKKIKEEVQIEEKLQKEMPELKFEKQDPFAPKEGGWAVPYAQLKLLLEEE